MVMGLRVLENNKNNEMSSDKPKRVTNEGFSEISVNNRMFYLLLLFYK